MSYGCLNTYLQWLDIFFACLLEDIVNLIVFDFIKISFQSSWNRYKLLLLISLQRRMRVCKAIIASLVPESRVLVPHSLHIYFWCIIFVNSFVTWFIKLSNQSSLPAFEIGLFGRVLWISVVISISSPFYFMHFYLFNYEFAVTFILQFSSLSFILYFFFSTELFLKFCFEWVSISWFSCLCC